MLKIVRSVLGAVLLAALAGLIVGAVHVADRKREATATTAESTTVVK